MSSFAARFYFHGGDPAGYDVHACDYFFDQSTDDKGRPSSTVQGGAIVLVLPSNDDTHALNWMFDPYAQKDGWVDFYRADQRSVMKKVAFTKATAWDIASGSFMA